MKKLLILFLICTFSIFAFSNYIDEIKEISNEINNENISWKADVSQYFYDLNEYANFTDLDSVYEVINGNRDIFELPGRSKLEKENEGTANLSSYYTYNKYFYTGSTVLPRSLIQYHTSIKNQYAQGICWAMATTASFESSYGLQVLGVTGKTLTNESAAVIGDAVQNNISGFENDFSEQYTAYHNIDWDLYSTSFDFYQMGISDIIMQDSAEQHGGNAIFSFYNLTRYGIIPESFMPHIMSTSENRIEDTRKEGWKDNVYRANDYLVVETLRYGGYPDRDTYVNSIKEALMKYGAMSVSYTVPSDFSAYSHGVYIPQTATPSGGHAVTLVGWVNIEELKSMKLDDGVTPLVALDPAATCLTWTDVYNNNKVKESTEFWVIKNSWDSTWGYDGYFITPIISESEFNDISAGNEALPNWRFEYNNMYVSVITGSHVDKIPDFDASTVVDGTDFNLLVAAIKAYISSEDKGTFYDANKKFDLNHDLSIDFDDLKEFTLFINNLP